MSLETDPSLSDDNRLLLGAGFVFGVMFTLLVLALVVLSGSASVDAGTQAVVTIVAGVVFAGIVGVGLYMLSFPENRTKIPIGSGDDEDESA